MVETPNDAPPPQGSDMDRDALAASPFGQVPIEISITIGHAHPLVSELMALQEDSVLPLDRRIGDPVDLTIGGRLIARGILKEMDSETDTQLAVCLTEVVELKAGQ